MPKWVESHQCGVCGREEGALRVMAERGKSFGIRTIWVLAPTLLLPCWVTLSESLALSEHLFPQLLKRVRVCHCVLIKPVMQSSNFNPGQLVLSFALPICSGLTHFEPRKAGAQQKRYKEQERMNLKEGKSSSICETGYF